MTQLPNQKDFLLKYNLTEEQFQNSGSTWDILVKIHKDYCRKQSTFENVISLVYKTLINFEKIHSIRSRIKDPEHLIEKIIRKRIKEVTVENYQEHITDLMGIRVMHLFKNDWEDIHVKLAETFDFYSTPEAKVREGDSVELRKKFIDVGMRVENHKYGYRSIHYLLNIPYLKTLLPVELQVRTIFEEAWSEIDHQVRYPYDQENELYKEYLMILNRLAGSADEMGSFIEKLRLQQKQSEIEHQKKDLLIAELQSKLNFWKAPEPVKLAIDQDIRKIIEGQINMSKVAKGFLEASSAIKGVEAYKKMMTFVTESKKSNEVESRE